MPQSSNAVVIAGSGAVHVAPVGTALPTDSTTALNSAFIDLGYINDDGATFRDEKTKEPITSWQTFYAIKYVVTDASAELEFVLQQWDKNTVPLAFGGGTVTAPTAGNFRYEPPDPEDIDERALVLSWNYDSAVFRLVVPKVMVTSGVESQLTKAQAAELPITVGVVGTDGAKPWLLYTTHSSLNPA